MTISFKNKTLPISEVLGRVITIKKNELIINGRFLRGDSKKVFRIGTLKTKLNAFKQFELVE
jgi:hypothetical protein